MFPLTDTNLCIIAIFLILFIVWFCYKIGLVASMVLFGVILFIALLYYMPPLSVPELLVIIIIIMLCKK